MTTEMVIGQNGVIVTPGVTICPLSGEGGSWQRLSHLILAGSCVRENFMFYQRIRRLDSMIHYKSFYFSVMAEVSGESRVFTRGGL